MNEEQTAEEFARDFLLGELIKASSLKFKFLEKPFMSLKQAEQKNLLESLKRDIEVAVRRAVDIIASDNRVTFHAQCEQVGFKSDGVKATLSMANTMNAHALADSAGRVVMIVIEDGQRYLDAGNATEGEPDQKELV